MESAEIILKKSKIASNTRKVKLVPIIVLASILILSFLVPAIPGAIPTHPGISLADTGWMLTATAFVLIMTPGLAFFYGGMVNKKNVLSTMLQSFVSMVLITLLWVIIGFSLSFGDSIGGIIGNPGSFL
jgi:Amt family ammonium transporter